MEPFDVRAAIEQARARHPIPEPYEEEIGPGLAREMYEIAQGVAELHTRHVFRVMADVLEAYDRARGQQDT